MSRLFIAAAVPDEVRTELSDRLPRPAEQGVRWVPEHQWHVTLRFLGAVDEGDAVDALRTCTGRGAIATLGPQVSRLGRDVVCLPVSGLDALARDVRSATADLGRPPDRPFVGHLTLARLRGRAACGVTGARVHMSYPVTEIVLVRSTLGAEGALHEPLFALDLGSG